MRRPPCSARLGRSPGRGSQDCAREQTSRSASHIHFARPSLSFSFSSSFSRSLTLLPLIFLCLNGSATAAELSDPHNDPTFDWWHLRSTQSTHVPRILLNTTAEHTTHAQPQSQAGTQATGVSTAVPSKATATAAADTGSAQHEGETGGPAKTGPQQQQQEQAGPSGLLYVRWCCVGPSEMEFCQATVPTLTSRQESQHWSCVVKESKEACMDAVGAGEAELVGLDAGLAYRAFTTKRMKAIAAERMDYGEYYDAVAIVHKKFCLQAPRGRGNAEDSPRADTPAAFHPEGARYAEGTSNGTSAPAAGAGGVGRGSQAGGVPKATAGADASGGAAGGPGHGQAGPAGVGKGPGLWKLMPRLRSCHPFYGSSAGWDLPTLLLLSLRFPMPWDSRAPGETPGVPPQLQGLTPDAQVMGSVFTKSCAPSTSLGAASGTPGGSGKYPLQDRRLCSGCQAGGGGGGGKAGEGEGCDLGDPYAGYSGAYRCLVEGAGDIAFTRASVAPLFSRGGHYAQAWSTLPVSEFRYLCPPPLGGCVEISDNPAAFNCTIGRIPSNVIMTRNAIPEMDKLRIISRLETAGTVPRWRAALYEGGHNPNDYLLTSGARGLVRVDKLTRAYLGEAGVAAARVQSFNFKEEAVEGLGNAASQVNQPRILLLCTFILSSMLVLDWRVRDLHT